MSSAELLIGAPSAGRASPSSRAGGGAGLPPSGLALLPGGWPAAREARGDSPHQVLGIARGRPRHMRCWVGCAAAAAGRAWAEWPAAPSTVTTVINRVDVVVVTLLLA